MGDLLGCHRLAGRFAGGQCLIFRLTVEDYHRYCYPEDGVKSRNRLLGSELHTVNPIALEGYNIYKRNCRSACLIRTAHLGTIAMIEVGALMVGKIVNHHGAGVVRRGAEKGSGYSAKQRRRGRNRCALRGTDRNGAAMLPLP